MFLLHPTAYIFFSLSSFFSNSYDTWGNDKVVFLCLICLELELNNTNVELLDSLRTRFGNPGPAWCTWYSTDCWKIPNEWCPSIQISWRDHRENLTGKVCHAFANVRMNYYSKLVFAYCYDFILRVLFCPFGVQARQCFFLVWIVTLCGLRSAVCPGLESSRRHSRSLCRAQCVLH